MKNTRTSWNRAHWNCRALDAARQQAAEGGAKKGELDKLDKARARHDKTLDTPRKKVAERDEKIAEIEKRAAEERAAIETVGAELRALYADPAELAKHVRVVDKSEIEENEWNLNIPRYVDTFEPEEAIDVGQAFARFASRRRCAQNSGGMFETDVGGGGIHN